MERQRDLGAAPWKLETNVPSELGYLYQRSDMLDLGIAPSDVHC
jgi:hypothetical protein